MFEFLVRCWILYPKGSKSEAQGATRVPIGGKRLPKESQGEAKGNQREPGPSLDPLGPPQEKPGKTPGEPPGPSPCVSRKPTSAVSTRGTSGRRIFYMNITAYTYILSESEKETSPKLSTLDRSERVGGLPHCKLFLIGNQYI